MSFLNAGTFVQKFVTDWTKGKPEELMQAVLDARTFNRTITEGDVLYTEGKKRTLQINYYPPECEDTADCSDNICDAGDASALQQMRFTLSQCTASKVKTLSKDDVRYVDNQWDFSEHAMQQMAALMPTVRHKMAVQMAALMVSNIGVLPDGNASRLLPFVSNTTGVAEPVGMWDIEQDFRDAGYSTDGQPFIVGGTAVWRWKKSTEIGGLTATGQYLDRMRKDNLYYDKLVNTTFNNGAENVIAFDPQMIKFVAFNEHDGLFSTDKKSLSDITSMFKMGAPDRIEGVMPDAFTGLLWDLDLKYDPDANDCRGGWKWQIYLNWDIFFMPAKVCNIPGVTGIFHYTTCTPQLAQCAGSSPVTPTSSALYTSSAAGLVYPLQLNELTIAGKTVNPSQNEPVSVATIAELVTILNANAPSGYVFSNSGSTLRYTGYAPISVVINGSTTLTFS